ncbi:hypothetical protein MM35RIKEN_00690 [Vescimonas fastidiosa]|uniref:Uncharacterized protein n=1 Tax=Vescimonas fastidiosa TaxID=2714353 RepID=A0A810PUX4_9FIRM|nr:hypothetical protein MM35RIKEN_00690 [Vescimonas fastidiosa]
MQEVQCKSGRGRTPPLRKRYKGCDAKRNPPVTASPCQPPLGKGAEGTGGTDCHDQFAHWLRNDIGFHKKCGADPVRVVREADPYTPFTDKQNFPVRI